MGKTKDLSEFEIKIGLSAKDLISAIKKLNGEDREFLVENLLAATSPEYLESIKEARKDYKEGRTISHPDNPHLAYQRQSKLMRDAFGEEEF